MKILKRKSLTLYLTIPPSKDSQYDVVMELAPTGGGYVVYGMNGRRGAANTRQLKTKDHAVDYNTADSLWHQLLNEKRDKKGYTTDPSGRPHAGVSLATLDQEFAPGPIPDALLALVEQPQQWEADSSASFEMALTSGARSLQIRPAGTRILVATSVSAQAASTVSPSGHTTIRSLPARLQEALQSRFRNWVLDGVLEAGEFTVMDGYSTVPGTKYLGITPFEVRTLSLQTVFKERVLPDPSVSEVLKLQPVYAEDTVAEAAFWFAGSQAVLRLPGMPYLYDEDPETPPSLIGTL